MEQQVSKKPSYMRPNRPRILTASSMVEVLENMVEVEVYIRIR